MRTSNSNDAGAQSTAGNCYIEVRSQLELHDFHVRQQMFAIAQQQSIRIVFVSLFILIVATASGIILAGLQMLASFNLMSKGYEWIETVTEFVVKYNSLALRSSAVGVSIFGISMLFFAFFIYMVNIFSSVESPVGRAESPVGRADSGVIQLSPPQPAAH